ITTPISSARLTLATFVDGGWFGTSGVGPAPGSALTADHLVEPRVEVSVDAGVSWHPAAFTSDYVSALTGHLIGGGTQPNPTSVTATFTLDQPTNGISGIRLVGTAGGGASGGFIGVSSLDALSAS